MKEERQVRLLLADNDAAYRRSVRSFLILEDYEVEEAGTLEDSLAMLASRRFDLVLVDLRMQDDSNASDTSGLEIAKFASEHGIPCILITAFPSLEVVRAALRSIRAEAYAKDIITKGSDPQAVLDSISLTLRYAKPAWHASQIPFVPPPVNPSLELDPKKRLVTKDGKPLKLSRAQYTLLEALFSQVEGLCTYAELMLAIYGEESNGKTDPQDKRLRNLVDRTSEKIDDEDHHYIKAVTGRGYMLNLKS
jgi:DNA-binding response OmpR family regulator